MDGAIPIPNTSFEASECVFSVQKELACLRFEIAQLGPEKLKAVATRSRVFSRAWSFECFPPSGDGSYEFVNSLVY